MATMHYLLLGILSVAVLFPRGIGHRALERDIAEDKPRSMAVGARPGQQGRRIALRERIVVVAVQEIGVREATGQNDGRRVEAYLAYTGLGKGHAWCAAFVSWCYGRAGQPAPRNAWSPALFPMSQRYTGQQVREGNVRSADLFAIYNQRLARIDHAGIVRKREGNWLLTVEGNVDNRVVCKRRSVSTIHAFSNWLD